MLAERADESLDRTYLPEIERAGATWWIMPPVKELASLEEIRSLVRPGPWGDRG